MCEHGEPVSVSIEAECAGSARYSLLTGSDERRDCLARSDLSFHSHSSLLCLLCMAASCTAG